MESQALLEYYEKEYTDWFVNHFGSNAEPIFFFEMVEVADQDHARVRLVVDDITSIELLCPLYEGVPYSVRPTRFTWVIALNKVLQKQMGRIIYGHVLHLIHFCYLSDRPFTNELESQYFNATYKYFGEEWVRVLEAKLETILSKVAISPILPTMYKDPVRTLAQDVLLANNMTRNLRVEPVNDILYTLRVFYTSFDANSQIHKDLRHHGYNHVEMRLTFHKEAYPFYPPTADIVSPRLKGIDGTTYMALHLLEPFNFDYWDPAQPLITYLKDIHFLIQKFARVDEEVPDNSDIVLEEGLLHLEKHYDCPSDPPFRHLTKIAPPTINFLAAASPYYVDNKTSSEHRGWAKGIGYGSNESHNPVYILRGDAFKQMQQKLIYEKSLLLTRDDDYPDKKKARTSKFSKIPGTFCVKPVFKGPVGPHGIQTTDDLKLKIVLEKKINEEKHQEMENLHQTMIQGASKLQKKIEMMNQSIVDPPAPTLKSSPQSSGSSSSSSSSNPVPKFSSEVYDDSGSSVDLDFVLPTFSHMGSQDSIQKDKFSDYTYGFTLSKHPTTRTLWSKEAYLLAKMYRRDQSLLALREVYFATRNALPPRAYPLIRDSILLSYLEENLCSVTLLEAFSKSEIYLTCLTLISKLVTNPEVLQHFIDFKHGHFVTYLKNVAPEAENGLMLLETTAKTNPSISLFSTTIPEQINQLDLLRSLVKLHQTFTAVASTTSATPPAEESSSSQQELPVSLPLEDQYKAWLKPLLFDSCSMAMPDVNPALSGPQVLRISHELKALAQDSLPLDIRSSIFVRSNENNLASLKAMITGPEDTPYANGCYFFEFTYPDTYPQVPPKVVFLNRASGHNRINPNLYNTGYICLSLLGTWHGVKHEKWSPSSSTTLQVLISIQSMIFTADPYFNEPGFEKHINTPQGYQMSQQYNQNVYQHTIEKAMIGILKDPPPHFEEIVRRHFYLKRDIILNQTEQWAKEVQCKAHLSQRRSQLKELLDALTPPDGAL